MTRTKPNVSDLLFSSHTTTGGSDRMEQSGKPQQPKQFVAGYGCPILMEP